MQTSKAKRYGSVGSIYKTTGWRDSQAQFEINLGKYARKCPKAHFGVNTALRQMKNVLCTYYYNQLLSNGKQNFYLQAFTKNEPSTKDEIVSFIDTALYGRGKEEPLSGDLCKKMTAFYNASGISSDASNQSINFKNIMQKIVTSNSRRSDNLIKSLHLNKSAVGESIKHNSKNIFKAGLSSGLHNIFKGPDVYDNYGMDFKSYDKYDRGLKVKYNMDKKKEPTSENKLENTNDTVPEDIKGSISPNGFRLTANGSSSTTTKLLNTAKWLGLSREDLLNFRLAIMGWLLPDGDHSLYEILYSSHAAGVRGKEDLTDAASMDKTIDPLAEDEIRDGGGIATDTYFEKQAIYLGDGEEEDEDYHNPIVPTKGENKFLPLEKLIYKKFYGANNNNPLKSKFVSITSQDMQQLSSKIYTSNLHQFLNNKLDFNHYFGQYLGNTIFKKIIHYNTFNDLFKKILDTKTELSNNDIYKNIINSLTPQYHKILKLSIASAINNSQDIKNIQEDYKSLISRLSHENLTEKQLRKHIDSFVSFSINKYLNSNLNNLLDDIDIINSNQSDILNKSKKYSGTVYSGQRITKAYRHFYKIGKIITLSSNMSTSSVRDVAMGYASQKINSSVFLTPVVFEIQLTGKNGIDISGFSTFNSEHEILLLPGTHLKVKSIETIALDKNTYAPLIKLEEVGNTPQALRSWAPQDPNSPKNYPTKFY